MADLPTYPWFDQVPDHLKTRKQLAEQGLRPGGPVVAQVVWKRGKRWADLYDVSAAKPKQTMTEAQAAALEKARAAQRRCYGCGEDTGMVIWRGFRPERDCPRCYEAHVQDIRQQRADDRAEAYHTARAWLHSQRTVILDSETTDLDGYLVQLAIIRAHDGAVLLDTLVNPEAPISDGARAVHGISDAQLAHAPTFEQIADQVLDTLAGRRVVTYNAAFDHGILQNELVRLAGGWRVIYAYHAAVEVLRRPRWRCAMELRAQAIGDWSSYHGNYRWYPLDGGDHSALGDCRACRDVLVRMAERDASDRRNAMSQAPADPLS